MGWGGTSRRSCCLFTNLYIYLLSFTIVHSKYSLVLCLVPSARYGPAPRGWFFPFLLGGARGGGASALRLGGFWGGRSASRGVSAAPLPWQQTPPSLGHFAAQYDFSSPPFLSAPLPGEQLSFSLRLCSPVPRGGRRARPPPCSPEDPLAWGGFLPGGCSAQGGRPLCACAAPALGGLGAYHRGGGGRRPTALAVLSSRPPRKRRRERRGRAMAGTALKRLMAEYKRESGEWRGRALLGLPFPLPLLTGSFWKPGRAGGRGPGGAVMAAGLGRGRPSPRGTSLCPRRPRFPGSRQLFGSTRPVELSLPP